MTVTESDRQASGNAVEIEDDREFHNARARDNKRTTFSGTLPDTDRYQEALANWWERVKTVTRGLWDGSFWDEQPPSPRELVQRCQESSWAHSDYRLLRTLCWTGCVISIAWSVPLYGLAIVGQRLGRALTVALILWAFWNLV